MVKKVCCVIYSKDYPSHDFLILHKDAWWNGWEFVKGEKRRDESIEETALREVNEETGLNITDIRQVPFTFTYEYLKGLDYVKAEVACFVAESSEENVTLSEEHDYYKWVDYDRVLALLEFDEQKQLLKFIHDKIL